jgi:hypothetical protein
MARRRRRTVLARSALGLLVLAAELTGRSLAYRIDLGRHVGRVSYADAAYYPALVLCVKVGVALMLARLVWRFFHARRVASVLGTTPRIRLGLSWRLWLAAFAGTTGVFLLQTNAEHAAVHSAAIPVFAVLAVIVAVLYRAAEQWLGDYERIAAVAVALLQRVAAHRPALCHPRRRETLPPRRLFGLAFESRPPPLPA